MSYSFGDSFDLYATGVDLFPSYWDSNPSGQTPTFGAGRFAGSRAVTLGGNVNAAVLKSSGVNDAVHHVAVAVQVTSAFSGTTPGHYITFYDGTTAQCTIVFRTDGAILLTSGIYSGATLATYSGAVAATNTWYAFEFEVVINNTTGSFKVRKNGNSTEDFTATALNTRGGTANNYANKIGLGNGSGAFTVWFDDLFWKSDASSVAWLGDIRCYTRMPATDQSVTFSGAGTRAQSLAGASGLTAVANRVNYSPFSAMTWAGTIGSATLPISAAYTGNLKFALYNDNGAGAPGTILATATNTITNPAASSTITFTFSPPVSVAVGQKLWSALSMDSAGSTSFTAAGTDGWQGTTTFASFPVANPSSLSVAAHINQSLIVTPINSNLVNEAQQDAAASYVYSSNPGDADFYGIASIAATPATVLGVTTRAFMQKSDAGTRTAAVQLKSGGSTVASPTLTLTPGAWQWAWRMDLVDPATSAAWTAAAVNTAQIGPKVIA